MSHVQTHELPVLPDLPAEIQRWELTGAGLESLEEVTTPLPTYGQDEILVRHDACGICFSDIKIINLGPDHPRLQGRDMKARPVVMGHEVSLTVVGVGENRKHQFQIGQRYIVQADVYYHGVNSSYGYALDGGMAQYGVVTKEVLDGDEGCYLIPVQDTTGYSEAALVEPWACVVAAYEYPNYRDGVADEGRLLIVDVHGALYGDEARVLFPPGHPPAATVTVGPEADFAKVRAEETADHGFDDIVVLGTPTAADLGRIATALGYQGILNLIWDERPHGKSAVDIGRIHYEQHLYVGSDSPTHATEAYTANTRRDLKPGGTAWFVGAGGPMGQMHVQRALMSVTPPARIVLSDKSSGRLETLRTRFAARIANLGIELILANPDSGDDPAAYGPFDDIVLLVPSAALLEETIPHLAEYGVYNLFAGVAKGVIAQLDLGTLLTKHQRLIGTSGSSIEDLRHTLDLVETSQLSTNASVAAIGGLNAFRAGLEAVKTAAFPGKTVIYPQIADLPLLALTDLQSRLPAVFAKLEQGTTWTRDAEAELLKEY